MIVVPFLPVHLEGFEPQKNQPEVNGFMEGGDYGEFLFNVGSGYTGIYEGNVIVIAGLMQVSECRAISWVIFSNKMRGHAFLLATRRMKEHLNSSPFPRIEAIVSRDFVNGARWAELMGFKRETPDGMEHFYPDGKIYDLYARIRK